MNIKETTALTNFCVQDQEKRCRGSKCMAWRPKIEYPEPDNTSMSSHLQTMHGTGKYNHEYGHCGLVD